MLLPGARLQSHLDSSAASAVIYVSAGLAFVTLLHLTLGVTAFFYAYLLRPGPQLRRLGSWAVVTGATDGIGKAYATALAKQGLNLVLVSRTQSRLEACACQLRAHHGVQVLFCVADLCRPDDATFVRLAACMEGLDVGLLINNAGQFYDHPEYLENLSDGFVTDLININMVALTRMAKLVLLRMKERRRGVIVNVGSGLSTAARVGPLLTVYCASKAYVEAFSQSLDAECQEFGVRVQNQTPHFVRTKMTLGHITGPRLDVPTPDAYAATAVLQIGREASFSPYWLHGLQRVAGRLQPQSWVTAYLLRYNKAWRQDALGDFRACSKQPDKME